MFPKNGVPDGVPFLPFSMEVLSAVQLNDESGLPTIEINNILADNSLTAKTNPGQLPATKPGPEKPFGIRHVAAEFSNNLA